MSDEPIDNYDKEFKLLKRLIEQPSFKFIIIRYNHYDLINRLKQDLTHLFPDRPLKSVETSETDYREFMDTWESLESGFLMMEHFEDVLLSERAIDTKEEDDTEEDERRRGLTSGMNLRRDKIAEKPNVLIMLLASTVDENSARNLMSRIPDLWSLRSMFLDIKKPWDYYYDISIEEFEKDELESNDRPIEEVAKDAIEIERLLLKLSNLKTDEKELKLRIYPRLAELMLEVKQGEEAIRIIKDWSNLKMSSRQYLLLGDAYYQVGEIREAFDCYEKFITSTSGVEGKDQVRKRLKTLLKTDSKEIESNKFENFIQKIFDLDSSNEQKDMLSVMRNHKLAGDFYLSAKLFEKAKAYYQESIDIHQSKYKNLVFDSLHTLFHNYGIVLMKENQFAAAFHQFKLAEYIIDSTHRKHTDKARIKYSLGMSSFALDKLDQAIHYYEEGLEIYDNLLSQEAHETARGHGYLGGIYLIKKDYFKAITHLYKAYEIDQNLYGDYHTITANRIHKLGEAFGISGQIKRSKEQFEKELKSMVHLLGKEHPKTITSMQSIIKLLKEIDVDNPEEITQGWLDA